jgi:hypothetical protein
VFGLKLGTSNQFVFNVVELLGDSWFHSSFKSCISCLLSDALFLSKLSDSLSLLLTF